MVSLATENGLTNQQALCKVITELQHVCDDLDLDFTSAIDHSAIIYEDETFPFQYCAHSSAFVLEDGLVFCPQCNNVISKPAQRP